MTDAQSYSHQKKRNNLRMDGRTTDKRSLLLLVCTYNPLIPRVCLEIGLENIERKLKRKTYNQIRHSSKTKYNQIVWTTFCNFFISAYLSRILGVLSFYYSSEKCDLSIFNSVCSNYFAATIDLVSTFILIGLYIFGMNHKHHAFIYHQTT